MSLVPGLFMKNDNKRTAGFLQSRKCFYFSSDFFFLSLRLFASRGQKQMTTFELFGSSACKAASPTKSHLVRPQVVVRNMKTPCFALPFGWACVQQVGEKKIYFIRSLFARILYRVERFWGRLMAKAASLSVDSAPFSRNLCFAHTIPNPIPFPRFKARNCTYGYFSANFRATRSSRRVIDIGWGSDEISKQNIFLSGYEALFISWFPSLSLKFISSEIIFSSFQLARKCR